MKVAILYDSKYGNTKKVAEFLGEKIRAGGHQVKLFRTGKTKPKELLEFQPMGILVGGPTHFGKPARTLNKYIKKLGKLGQESTIQKAGVFNSHAGDDVCDIIKDKVSNAFPQIEVLEKSLPMDRTLVDDKNKVILPENWENDVNGFVSDFLIFLS